MQFLQGHGQSTFLVSFDQMRASIAAWSKLKFSGLQFDETAPLVRAGEAENKGTLSFWKVGSNSLSESLRCYTSCFAGSMLLYMSCYVTMHSM